MDRLIKKVPLPILKDIQPCALCDSAPVETIDSRAGKLFRCGHCGLVFVDKAKYLSAEESRQRYSLHNNDSNDKGYCDFLSQAIQAAKPFLSAGLRGLDYGCGPGPTLSKLMQCEGFTVEDYDPLFFDRPLNSPYDFIFSTECFEHFENPSAEIRRVVSLLKPGGILTVMTELWHEKTDFKSWYYVTDPTHVSFYSQRSLDYICRTFGIRRLVSDGKRVFVFQKK